MSTSRFITRAGAVLGAAGALALLSSGVAGAHVTANVLGTPAAQGGYSAITFRVPTEDPKAGTVKLQVTISPKYALSYVSTRPMPGWKATLTKTKLDPPVQSGDTKVDEAVTQVTWTAEPGTRIAPEQFDEFEITAGKLPENTTQLLLPTKQTYDDGKVVDWSAPPAPAGAEEPEHPAPVVTLTPKAAGASADGDMPGMASPAANATNTAQPAPPVSGTDNAARWLGGAGLVIGALGLGIGIGATLWARRAVVAAKAKA